MDRREAIRRGLAVAVGLSPLGYWKGSCRLTHHRLRCDRPRLPRPLRLGLIADFHAPCYTFPLPRLHRLVEREPPDLLLILGDTIDDPRHLKLVAELFRPLPAKLGKFAVLGNHEHWCGVEIDALRAEYERGGVRLLVNERVEVGGLRLVGLDDMLGGKPFYSLAGGDTPTVVMSHCPSSIARIGEHLRGGLVLSGHTHGGQVAPLGIVIHTPGGSGKYVRGLYEEGDNRLFVSQGVGCIAFPIRLGVRPAYVTLEVG